MLVSPAVVGGLIFLYVCIIFIQIQFGKEDIKKPKKSFGKCIMSTISRIAVQYFIHGNISRHFAVLLDALMKANL